MEQNFQMRKIEDAIKYADREELVTIFLALQRQNFVLANNLSNLLNKWPKTNQQKDQTTIQEELLNLGISFETNT
ncbi:MAG: hypothetical protein CL779_02545 [Chloroflexi bacterium]|nr:hypothetical protein [Chloroflexota bacterium]